MKHRILVITILSIVIYSCNNKSDTFKIKGTIKGVDEGSQISLITYDNDTLVSTQLIDGEFSVIGSVAEPTDTYLSYGRQYINIVLENAVYEVAIDADAPTNSHVKGGHLNDMIGKYKFDANYIAGAKELDKLYNEYENVDQTDKEALYTFHKKFQEKNKIVKDISSNYFTKIVEGDYPIIDKFFALKNIESIENYSYDKKIELVKKYKEAYGPLGSMDDYITTLESMKLKIVMQKEVAVGNQYKNVVAKTHTGEEVKLSDIIAKNEYTLLEMWASWCGPCRKEFPHLKKAYAKFKDKGFEIYGLSIDDNEEKWLKAEADEEIPWISLVDHNAFNSNAIKDYGVLGIPAGFLIAKNGTIVASGEDIRNTNLEEKLEKLFFE